MKPHSTMGYILVQMLLSAALALKDYNIAAMFAASLVFISIDAVCDAIRDLK